jgi:hypothetical protein
MHDGERFGLHVGELFQVLRGEWCVRDILRKDARLILLHRLMRAAHDIGRGERFDAADSMEQVRTEQCSLRFFEEDASVPAVGQMRSPAEAKSVLPRCKGPTVSERAWLTANDVVHVHECTHLASDFIGLGRCG